MFGPVLVLELLRSSADPCHPNFGGPEPFSEPETRAIRDFLLARLPRLNAYVSLHTYGQIWIHPYGHAKNTYPNDIQDLVRHFSAEAIISLISVAAENRK